MKQDFTATQAAARTKYKGQSPRVWCIISDFGRRSQAIVINSQCKVIIACGPVSEISPKDALKKMARGITPGIKKSKRNLVACIDPDEL